jgi:O-antigen/teichoic acid export membrane protein
VLRGIGFISTLVLVRLLVPEDFGIVALAAAVQSTLETLTATGFGLALVRMIAPRPVHYDTVFTLSVARGALLSAGLVAFAGPQAALMGDARIADVMRLLAVTVFMQSFESVRLIDLQRELQFEVILRYTVVNKLLQFCITIPLALYLQNYWSLVAAACISRFVMVPYSYWLAPYRPRLSLGAWRELFDFSKWLLLGNVSSLLDSQLMNVVIGRMQGMAAVGLYQVGYQVAALPLSEIAAPLRAPAYAGFAKARTSIEAMRRQFLTSLELQWVVILPLSVGIAVTAPEVTVLFLGASWVELVPLMPIVALFALFDAIGVFTHNVFIVLNRQKLFVATAFAAVAVRLALVVLGASEAGLIGAAVAMLATAILSALVWLAMAGRLVRFTLAEIASRFWRATVAAGAMAGLVLLPAATVAPPGVGWAGLGALLLLKVAVGGIAYPAVLLMLWLAAGRPRHSAEAHILHAVRNMTTRLFRRLHTPR